MDVRKLISELTQQRKTAEKASIMSKERWLSEVGNLYDNIIKWLTDLTDDQSRSYVTHDRQEKHVSEDLIGDYPIEALKLNIAGVVIVFDPVGCNIIGAQGRIDLFRQGTRPDLYMLLMYENEDGSVRWELIKSGDRTTRMDFTKEAFEQVLGNLLQ